MAKHFQHFKTTQDFQFVKKLFRVALSVPLDVLQRMDNILGFLSFFFFFFSFCQAQLSTNLESFLFFVCFLFVFFFVRILLLLSCFWKVWLKRWKLKYQRCLYHAWSSISHWERLPLRSHYGIFFKGKGQTFPLIINCCCFRTVLWWI